MKSFLIMLRGLGLTRMAIMAGVCFAVFGFFAYLSGRLIQEEQALLFSELSARDSGNIAAQLEQMSVPFTISNDGNAITVPASQVGRLRVEMARLQLPAGGSIGYELFDDDSPFGVSESVQRVNIMRALEGELARSIISLEEVSRARVHLVLPQRRPFAREQQDATASVVITPTRGRSLNAEQVASVRHLIASAVPGLQPAAVAVVDQRGRLLASGDDDWAQLTGNNNRQRAFQNELARKIETLLERSLGAGNIRAEVVADIQYQRASEQKESFDPDSQIERSRQLSEEQQENNKDSQAPAITTSNDLPGGTQQAAAAAAQASRAERSSETVNYEISKTVTNLVEERHLINRLSVAVLVNDAQEVAADGSVTYQARSSEDMAAIRALVTSAIGYNQERGDQIEIINLRFASNLPEVYQETMLEAFGLTYVEIVRLVEILVFGLIAILALLFIVRPVLGRVMTTVLATPVAALPAAALRSSALALPTGKNTETSNPPTPSVNTKSQISLPDPKNLAASAQQKANEFVHQYPVETASILRSWMYQDQ